MSNAKRSKEVIRSIAVIALFTALNVVMGRLMSVNTSVFKISTSFIPTVLAAYYYGAAGGAIVAGLGDLIGALLFPTGAYFFPFTLSAALGGGWYGLILKGDFSIKKVLLAVIPEQIVCSLVLNGWFLSMLIPTKGFFEVILSLRLPQLAASLPIHIAAVTLLIKGIAPRLPIKRRSAGLFFNSERKDNTQ